MQMIGKSLFLFIYKDALNFFYYVCASILVGIPSQDQK